MLVGFGALFAAVTLLLLWIDHRFVGTEYNSENFQTAGREIKTGLISGKFPSTFSTPIETVLHLPCFPYMVCLQ